MTKRRKKEVIRIAAQLVSEKSYHDVKTDEDAANVELLREPASYALSLGKNYILKF